MKFPYLPISHILKFWACTYYCIRFQVKHILVNGKNTSFPKIFKTLNRNLKLTYYSGKIPDMTSQPHLFSLQNIVNTGEDFDNFYRISRTFQPVWYIYIREFNNNINDCLSMKFLILEYLKKLITFSHLNTKKKLLNILPFTSRHFHPM